MPAGRDEAIAAAKKLLRTFGSAPDPKRQARAVYAELSQVEGWTPAQRREVAAFGQWLSTHPSFVELKPRCQELLTKLV